MTIQVVYPPRERQPRQDYKGQDFIRSLMEAVSLYQQGVKKRKKEDWKTEVGQVLMDSNSPEEYFEGIKPLLAPSMEKVGFGKRFGESFSRKAPYRGGIDEIMPMVNSIMQKRWGEADREADDKRDMDRRLEFEEEKKRRGLGVYRPSATRKGDKAFSAREIEDLQFQLQASEELPKIGDWKTMSGYAARSPSQKKQLRAIYQAEFKARKEGSTGGKEGGKRTGNFMSDTMDEFLGGVRKTVEEAKVLDEVKGMEYVEAARAQLIKRGRKPTEAEVNALAEKMALKDGYEIPD